jgi:hypothetical protein
MDSLHPLLYHSHHGCNRIYHLARGEGALAPLRESREGHMKKSFYLLVLLAIVLASCSRSSPEPPAAPIQLDQIAAERVVKEIEKDRAETREWLRSSANSYLAAIDRVDFEDRQTLTVGRAADNNLRLNGEDIAPHHLRIKVEGDRFRIECVDAKAVFKINEEMKREATVDPSYIQVGRFSIRLSHQRFPALIVFDPQSPRFKQYKGISYFPIDLSYRYEVELKRYPKPEKTTIMSTRGNLRSAERVGWVDFLVANTPCRLEATHLTEPGSSEDSVDIFFRDATTGKESYSVGRYVDLKKLKNGKYLLDFNLAYNPACAFSEYYNCPIPPKANTLKIAIRAGEKQK